MCLRLPKLVLTITQIPANSSGKKSTISNTTQICVLPFLPDEFGGTCVTARTNFGNRSHPIIDLKPSDIINFKFRSQGYFTHYWRQDIAFGLLLKLVHLKMFELMWS